MVVAASAAAPAAPTVSATTTATTVSATAAGTTTAAATTTAALLRAGLVYRQVTALEILAVERGDGSLRLLIAAHLDEAEALGTPGIAIGDHLRRHHRAVRGKHLLQVALVHVVAQVADVKLLTHWKRSLKKLKDCARTIANVGAVVELSHYSAAGKPPFDRGPRPD